MVPFAQKLEKIGYPVLRAGRVSTLQVNLGWRCNQACHHCHLTAGPGRPEQMGLAAVEAVIAVVARWALPVVDLTGGSPEINPHFEYLVDRLHRLGTHLLVRCNLTILLEP
ncbi:MAG: radical SAM protein, partial [Desulfobaccales bacterium]